MSANILSDYMTQEQLAAELDVAVRTLRVWERQRVGPPITKIRRRVVYARAGVVAWLRAQERRHDIGRRRTSQPRATVAA